MQPCPLDDGLVEEQGLADIFDFGDRAFEVKGFGEDDFEDLGRSGEKEISLGRGGVVGKMEDDDTFCTLMLWEVLLKMRLARIAFAKRRAWCESSVKYS